MLSTRISTASLPACRMNPSASAFLSSCAVRTNCSSRIIYYRPSRSLRFGLSLSINSPGPECSAGTKTETKPAPRCTSHTLSDQSVSTTTTASVRPSGICRCLYSEADPFLPLLENFVGEFRSPFLTEMYLNFMEVTPRAEELPFIGCVERWLEHFPDSNRFWIEMNFGEESALFSLRSFTPCPKYSNRRSSAPV